LIRKYAIVVLACLLCLMVVGGIVGAVLLRGSGAFMRFQAADDLDEVTSPFDSTAALALAAKFDGTDHRALLRELMNSVSTIGFESSDDLVELYRHAQAGGGLLCGKMAELFFNLSRANGIPARIVVLRRHLFDIYDTHTTVEVCEQGRWVIYDPTFHVSFRHKGELQGATEIQQALVEGYADEIEPVFYGDVAYPARLEDYYTHWLPLSNNVLVLAQKPQALLDRLPPFRYARGPIMRYQNSRSQSDHHFRFQDKIYFRLTVVMPVMFTVCLILLLLLILPGKRSRVPDHD
jgi:hypothetical protein